MHGANVTRAEVKMASIHNMSQGHLIDNVFTADKEITNIVLSCVELAHGSIKDSSCGENNSNITKKIRNFLGEKNGHL